MVKNLKPEKPLFALDLGTTKFCIAMLRFSFETNTYQVETCAVPAAGMRRGMLSDLGKAAEALELLVSMAERQFDSEIERVVVGVAGSHLKGKTRRISKKIHGTVKQTDLEFLQNKVESEYQNDSRELLHSVPQGYWLNHEERIDNPVGFSGDELFADYFLIDADKYYLKDIVNICNDQGIQVTRLYSEPFASASVTVPDQYKELGVAVADIGGGTTDGIVFQNGRPVEVFTVNVGGRLMTNDIAIGLSLPYDEAEKVKIRFGLQPRPQDSSIEVKTIKGQDKIITAGHSAPILKARIQELSSMMGRSLQSFRGQLGAGILLTGGGSEVKGIDDFMESRLSIPVAKSKPTLIDQSEGQKKVVSLTHHDAGNTYSTKFATAVGLLNLELNRINERQNADRVSFPRRYLGQFVNWLRELS